MLLYLALVLKIDSLSLLQASVDNGAKESNVFWLNDVFTGIFLDDISCADVNVTYYVSDYIGRNISHCCKGSSCKELLIAGDDTSSIHVYLPDEYKQLFKNINHWCLLQPFEFTTL